MEEKPIMLWHSAFYDHPLDGLALYKNKKVWFAVSDDGGWEHFENENQVKSLDPYYYDIDFDKDEDGTFTCCKYTLYKLYEIPEEYLKQHEERHKLFQEFVGYHTDHDPKIYKPFNIPNWTLEYKNNKF